MNANGHFEIVKTVKSLYQQGRYDESLATLRLLGDSRFLSPYLLTLESALIQLQSGLDGETLEDAESCLEMAYRINPLDIDSLADLFYFYDRVNPDSNKREKYRAEFISKFEKLREIILDLENAFEE